VETLSSLQPHLSHQRKGIFINLSLFQFLSFVRRGIFYTFMISYIYDLMQTVTYTALLGSLNMLASALGQNLLWGKIADRHKLRAKLVIAGESTAAVSYLVVYQIHKALLDAQASFQAGLSLIIGLSALEFFWSMSDVGWAALLTEATTTKTRARTVGILNFIASLGRMIGINFAGYLYNGGEGFRSGTIFYIVIAMLAVSSAIMWIASKTTEEAPAKTETLQTEVDKKENAAFDTNAYRWFLVSLVTIIIGVSCISQVFLLFIKLREGLYATDSQMSLILTAYTIGGMMISLTCGWLADRIGREKVLFAGLVLAALTPALYSSATNVPTMALVYGLSGASFWIILTVGFTLAGGIIPEARRGRLFSQYNTVIALSWGPAGLFVGGPLADIQVNLLNLPRYTAYVNVFYASAIIAAIGAATFTLKVAKPRTKAP